MKCGLFRKSYLGLKAIDDEAVSWNARTCFKEDNITNDDIPDADALSSPKFTSNDSKWYDCVQTARVLQPKMEVTFRFFKIIFCCERAVIERN